MALTPAQKLEAAVEVSPLTVLTLGVLAWIFPPAPSRTCSASSPPTSGSASSPSPPSPG